MLKSPYLCPKDPLENWNHFRAHALSRIGSDVLKRLRSRGYIMLQHGIKLRVYKANAADILDEVVNILDEAAERGLL